MLDTAQSAGSFAIDMEKDHISALCFTGHKGLMGPQGTGGVCIATGIALSPFKCGGSGVHSFSKTHPQEMPAVLEAGTLNVHGIAGLSSSLSFIKDNGIENLRRREQKLAEMLYEGVRKIPQVRIYGDWEQKERGAILSLNLAQEDAGAISDELYERWGICTRAGAHCAPFVHESFGTVQQGMVRFSFSPFNTEAEVQIAIQAIWEMAKEIG